MAATLKVTRDRGSISWKQEPNREAKSRPALLAELKACTRNKDLQRGRMLHSAAVDSGQASDLRVASSLVTMYARCGSIDDAKEVFYEMKDRDAVAWNSLLFGYAENGGGQEALGLFLQMEAQGVEPTARTFVALLKSCLALAGEEEAKRVGNELVKTRSLEKGMMVHSQAVRSELDSHIFVANTLIDLYGKCGCIQDAQKVFDGMFSHDVISWNTLLFGYAEKGEGEKVLNMFASMSWHGCAHDELSYVAALKAFTRSDEADGGLKKLGHGNPLKGMALHSLAVATGHSSSNIVANTLVDMYSKPGAMKEAQRVFDKIERLDVVSWTVLLAGYAENGQAPLALELFSCMRSSGCVPNALAFVAVLKACSCMAAEEDGKWIDGRVLKPKSLEEGMHIHSLAVKFGCDSHVFVANSLVSVYAKCGDMSLARDVFDKIKHPDMVSWNALILGYAENGEGLIAVEVFSRMQDRGFQPGPLTLAAALKACGAAADLETGKEIHEEVRRQKLDSDGVLVTTLVDFYAKCGSLKDAQEIFDSLTSKDIVTWNALMAGYGRQGETQNVLNLFDRMKDEGFQPSRVTFLCLLTACSHAGLVEQGKVYFESMYSRYRIRPEIEHYTCMFDLLGRAGELNLAMLKCLPVEPDATAWRAILGACVKWKSLEVGKLAFESLVKLDPGDAGAHVLMAEIYDSFTAV